MDRNGDEKSGPWWGRFLYVLTFRITILLLIPGTFGGWLQARLIAALSPTQA
jgi:hypothetical protein